MGMSVDEWCSVFAPPFAVFSDNWAAVCFFLALGDGSWNMGPNGPIGLRREAFREVRLALGIRLVDWPEIFRAVEVMDGAALRRIRESQR